MFKTSRSGPLTLFVLLTLASLVFLSCTSDAEPDEGASVDGEPAADDRAAEAMRELQGDIELSLHAPYYLDDLEPGARHLAGPDSAPIAVLNLHAGEGEEQRVIFQQSASSFGTVAPPPNLEEDRQVDVQGNDAELQVGGQDSQQMVQLIWEKDGLHFVIAGFSLAVDVVQRIAESVQPIE